MKVLITGSAGFIGYNFAKNLLEKKGFKIVGIDNFNDYYDEGDIFCTEESEYEGCEGKNYDQNNDGVYNNEVINILPFLSE